MGLARLPLVGASHVEIIESLEAMLFALAITNTIVTLIFNPWLRRTEGDRVPSIIQDVLVVALIGGVAYAVFGDKLLGASVGVAAALAFGLQDQLGNLFAGLAIQLERPFRVGHWISITNYEGRVVEVTWRATKIRTKAGNLVILPNAVMGRESVTNFSEPIAPTREFIEVGASYLVPPNEVNDAILTALARVPRVLNQPAPDAVMSDFGGSAIVYRARFWIDDFEQDETIRHEVRTAIYYEFNRRGIEIPWPIQIQYERREVPVDQKERRRELAATIAKVPEFATLPPEAHDCLAASTTERLFANGEAIVREGDPGGSMFIVKRGHVAVTIGPEAREVAAIEAGGYFGEMSMLTGDGRTVLYEFSVWSAGQTLLSGGSQIAHLDFSLPLAAPASAAATPARMTLDEAEQDMIRNALERCAGNIQKTAEMLGLSRAALYRRLEKFGIRTAE